MKMKRALLLLVAAPVADATTCTSSIADMFSSDIATGERGYLLTEDKPPLGATAGSNGETTDYMWNEHASTPFRGSPFNSIGILGP